MDWRPVALPADSRGQEALETRTLLTELTEFSIRAGHDLLGPLNQAGSLLALFIRRHKAEVGAEGDELLNYLQTASDRMENVVAGVRKYFEIAGRRPDFTSVDLNVSLASSLASLRQAVSASEAVVDSDPLPTVSADAIQMRTMFEILIGNSIKFQKPGTPPRIRVSVRAHGAPGFHTIAVEDNGIGFDAENAESAFQPFRRLNGREYPGAGLGLAMAKLIAGMHGGTILAAPSEGGGTTVEFTVPVLEQT